MAVFLAQFRHFFATYLKAGYNMGYVQRLVIDAAFDRRRETR
jgi:hypothetical protein